MIEDIGRLTGETTLRAEVAIVGAGPAGIVIALELGDRGVKVLLMESGDQTYNAAAQQLSDATVCDPDRHAPVTMAVRRQVGGASIIWGGRCVPYDPVDFEPRAFVGQAQWPVTYDEMTAYFQRASDWFLSGRAVFSSTGMTHLPRGIVPGLVDGEVTSSDLERWSLPTNFGKVYGERLRRSANVRLVTGATCTEIVSSPEAGHAQHLRCQTLAGGTIKVEADAFVVACGGLESTRLLLASAGPRGGALGDSSGHLGRWYMAHVEGVASTIQFTTPPRSTVYDYERDVDGVYIRRRFGFTKEFQLAMELPNISGWITNPELADASHGNGQLSFVYLALKSPLGPKLAPDAQRLSLTGVEIPGTPYGRTPISGMGEHLANIARHPLATGRFMAEFGTKRLLVRGRRAPGFFVYNEENRYPFQYHSEHLPNRDSRVTLVRETDGLGMPKLAVDLKFTSDDVDGVVRAHEHWDAHLRASGVGHLEYTDPDVAGTVAARMGGGFHQIGTTRMSTSPRDGVVDEQLKLHDVDNVYVASSSTFVTSSQANSTFMIVAFSVRLADHLAELARSGFRQT